MRKPLLVFWFIVLPILFSPFSTANSQTSTAAATDEVLKVRLLGDPDSKLEKTIQWHVLELALQKSGRAYDLALSKHTRVPGRASKQMQALGDEANVLWGQAYSAIENTLQPVPIPIFRGLMSYMQIFVREDEIDKFSHIQTIDELKEFSLLHGERFDSAQAFKEAGFDSRFAGLPNLINMLAHRRADMLIVPALLGKSMNRFDAEKLGIVPLDNIMVCFPVDHFFYIAPSGSEELRDAISTGLTAAMADGSYSTLISTHPLTGDSYDKIMQGDFKLLNINSPYLSTEALQAMSCSGQAE